MKLPTLHGEQLTLRPLEDADLDPLAAVIGEPSVARWWGESDEPERLRDNLRMDGGAFVIEADGELAGWLGFVEETEPEYRSVGIDISLSERFQGRGLGPDALRTLIRWFADERGHHRFTIDPNAANEQGDQGVRRSRLQADRNHTQVRARRRRVDRRRAHGPADRRADLAPAAPEARAPKPLSLRFTRISCKRQQESLSWRSCCSSMRSSLGARIPPRLPI